MLRELRVRDLALVAESLVRFEPGLNLLTGETGSGKSLIVDALGLALGARGGADQVRHGAERAVVEATFGSGDGALTLHREIGKRELFAEYFLLARAGRNDLREERAHLRQFGEHLQFSEQAFGHAHFEELDKREDGSPHFPPASSLAGTNRATPSCTKKPARISAP